MCKQTTRPVHAFVAILLVCALDCQVSGQGDAAKVTEGPAPAAVHRHASDAPSGYLPPVSAANRTYIRSYHAADEAAERHVKLQPKEQQQGPGALTNSKDAADAEANIQPETHSATVEQEQTRPASLSSGSTGTQSMSPTISAERQREAVAARDVDQLQPAVHLAEGPVSDSSSRVAPSEEADDDRADGPPRRLMAKPPSRGPVSTERIGGPQISRLGERLNDLPFDTTVTTVAAMSIVVGLFLLSIWLVRRGMPKASTKLPDNVVRVLGRKQTAPRQFAQLIQLGNKLLLVSVTPEGMEPLTEVTDPTEVDRIVGLCQQADPHSTTSTFQQVLDGLSRESAPSGFLGAEASFAAAGPHAAPYLGELGGGRHA